MVGKKQTVIVVTFAEAEKVKDILQRAGFVVVNSANDHAAQRCRMVRPGTITAMEKITLRARMAKELFKFDVEDQS